MSKRTALLLSALAVMASGVVESRPAKAGGDVMDRPPAHHYHHHHVRRITLYEEVQPMVRYAEPVIVQEQTGPIIRRGNFHGKFIGGNYAYNSSYQDTLTATGKAYLESHRVDPFVRDYVVNPEDPNSVYYSGIPYSRSTSVPTRGGGGIYDQSTSLMPAPTRGFFAENRTRDAYVYSYDYETENPACWSTQQVGGERRSVWTCAGR